MDRFLGFLFQEMMFLLLLSARSHFRIVSYKHAVTQYKIESKRAQEDLKPAMVFCDVIHDPKQGS